MRRAPVAAVLLVLALLLAGAGALWKERVAIANWAMVRALEGQGYGPARPGIEAVGLHLMRLRVLSLCGGALTAQDLSVRYDLLRLASFQLSDVAISGLEARLTMDASGARLGTCPLKGGRSGSLTGGIDRLTLSNAHIVLNGAEGPIDAMLSARLSIAGGAIEATQRSSAQLSMALEVSSVPLSETIAAGLPRLATRWSSSRATLRPEIEVSATGARHSRVQSSTTVRIRKRRPSTI